MNNFRSEALVDQIRIIRVAIYAHLQWSDEKIDLWLRTENPNLGGSSPLKLLESGRGFKVEKFVMAMLSENIQNNRK